MIPLHPLAASAAFELRAQSLSQALPRIGAIYSVPMRAAPDLAEEILVARLDGASIDEVKRRLAATFAADWSVAPDGTLVLSASTSRRKAEAREYARLRRERIEAHLRTVRAEAEALPVLRSSAPDERRSPDDRRRDPEFRLLLRIVGGLDAGAFVPDARRTRRVFSLTPTGTQSSLGANAADALRRYREEMGADGRGADRLLFKIDHRFGTAAELCVYDETGAEMWSAPAPVDESPLPTSNAKSDDVSVPPTAPVSAEEPLGAIAGPVLLAAARAAGRSMIVSPSDRLVAKSVLSGTTLLRWIDSPYGVVAFDAPGWMTVRTDHPAVVRSTFFPRKRLRRAIEGLGSRTMPKLSGLFAYARVRPEGLEPFTIDRVVFDLANPIRYVDYSDLDLPAALTPEEWSAAERTPVAFGRLGPRARALAVEALVSRRDYGAEYNDNWGCLRRPPRWEEEPSNTFDPSRATLKIDRDEEIWVRVDGPDGRILVPAYAYVDLWRNRNDSPDEERPRYDLARSEFFQRTTWNLHLSGGERTWSHLWMIDAPVRSHPGVFAPNDLPLSLRRELELDR